ncbi:hypothetical protein HQ447_17620 [bacterium]|nr:hypothetical protein [bacterium]
MKPGLIFLLCCVLGPACAPTQPKKPDAQAAKPAVEGPRLIGRIASVPADKRFVLIQSYAKWEIESGRILTTRGLDNRSANLRVTGETLGEFAAADLQSGLVEVGDAVYSQHLVKPIPPPAGAETLPAPEPAADAPAE